MSASESEPTNDIANQALATGDFASEVLVTERDYRTVGLMYRHSPSASTFAWNSVYRSSERYVRYRDWRSRTEEGTLAHEKYSEWLDQYSFAEGLYVNEDHLSAIVLGHLVDSGDLIRLPRVGVRSFKLSAEVVESIFSDR